MSHHAGFFESPMNDEEEMTPSEAQHEVPLQFDEYDTLTDRLDRMMTKITEFGEKNQEKVEQNSAKVDRKLEELSSIIATMSPKSPTSRGVTPEYPSNEATFGSSDRSQCTPLSSDDSGSRDHNRTSTPYPQSMRPPNMRMSYDLTSPGDMGSLQRTPETQHQRYNPNGQDLIPEAPLPFLENPRNVTFQIEKTTWSPTKTGGLINDQKVEKPAGETMNESPTHLNIQAPRSPWKKPTHMALGEIEQTNTPSSQQQHHHEVWKKPTHMALGEFDQVSVPLSQQHQDHEATNTPLHVDTGSKSPEAPEKEVHDKHAYHGRPLPWKLTFGSDLTADVNEYLNHFAMYSRAAEWNERVRIASFLCTLKGRAAQIVNRLPEHAGWDRIIKTLRTEWEPEERRRVLRENFPMTKRNRKETAEEFLVRLTQTANRAFTGYTENLLDEIVRTAFIKGQNDTVQNSLAVAHDADVNALLAMVIRLESMQAEKVRRTPIAVHRVVSTHSSDADDEQSAAVHLAETSRYNPPETSRYFPTNTDERYQPNPLAPPIIAPEVQEWVELALAATVTEGDGSYEEVAVYRVLQATATAKYEKTPGRACFFCKKGGHMWTKCFRLRDILVENGMRKPDDRRQRDDRRPRDERPHPPTSPPKEQASEN